MQLIAPSCILMAASLLASCGSPSVKKLSDEKLTSSTSATNPDLLSINGEIFPLSSFFGVCVRYKGIWDSELRSGPPGPHYPTGGVLTLAGPIKLKVSVGKFSMLPGTALKDVSVTAASRRIQIGREGSESFVLVSEFQGAGDNRVSFSYDAEDAEAKEAAMLLANNVVACHISAIPSN